MDYRLNIKNTKKKINKSSLHINNEKADKGVFDFTNYYMTYNGKPFFTVCGEFHFSRCNASSWEEELLKIKSCGVDTIATYMFWNYHEFYEGRFNFENDNNIRAFLELCKRHRLWVILRIGPYAHGECRNGGLPDWLFGKPFEVRSNDKEYLFYVERYFNEIGRQVSDLMYTKGGPVTAVQLENEYMAACSPWEITVSQNREWITNGTGGIEHIRNLKRLAENAGLKTAYYTSTGWGNSPVIEGEMLPLYGGYAYWPWLYWDNSASFEHPPTSCYVFEDKHNDSSGYPFACCELGGGMQCWYNYRFTVEPESTEAMSLVTAADGCNYIGYYMFHGGINQTIDNVYMNEQQTPRKSYDFQAPIGDSGYIRESYKRLKLLHYFYKDKAEMLCPMKTVLPDNAADIKPEDTDNLRYAVRTDGTSGFIFINNYQDHIEQKSKEKVRFNIETDSTSLIIPEHSSLNIEKGTACILPFNLKISGLTLLYSTAQYVMEIKDGKKTALFFFVHNGVKGEFCFDSKINITAVNHASTEAVDNKTFVHTADCKIACFETKGTDGETISFYCLDRATSLNLWKAEINGKTYSIISPANVYYSENELYFESVNIGSYDIMTYPPLPPHYTSTGSIEYTGEKSGLYVYRLTNELPRVDIFVSQQYANKALLKFDFGIMESLSELYLDIDYTGDIGWAFINNRLIHDDFYNGSTWRISLKQFKDELKAHDIYLYLSPLRGDNIKVESTETFAKINITDNNEAHFNKIELIPEKTQIIKFEK